MKVDIGNYHTGEQVGSITDEGELKTDSGALKEVANPLITEGIYSVFPYSTEDNDVIYREFHITTDDEGFLREFFDALPSPYDCDMEVLGELPEYEPDNDDDWTVEDREPGTREQLVENAVSSLEEGMIKDNSVTTGDAGYSNTSYGQPEPIDLDSERWSSDYMSLNKALEKNEMSLDELDNALHLAHKNVVQWEPAEGEDLSKAPNMWRGDDNVPDFVKELISFVLDTRDVIWDDVKGLPHDAGLRIKEILEENLTQPQGWSIDSLTEDFEEELRIEEDKARDIARQESGAVLNTTREVSYEATEADDEFVFYWSGADDSRTTEMCEEIKSEIESRGGAVPMDELKSILDTVSRKYEYGTPERVDDWIPHWKCRHTLVRDVQL